MATYEDLYGKRVKVFDSDPTLTSSYEGQVWYDSSTGNLKSVVASGVWHSSGSRITNSIPAGQGGTQNAAWFCGGTLGGSGPGTNTEEYNGSGWSAGGTLNTARRYGQGWGTQTAAITASGSPMSPPNSGMTATEEYNGTAWTAGTAVPSPYVRYNGAGMGAVQTAGAIFCGSQNPPDLNTTLEWDGSSWTGGGNYPFSGPIGTGSAGGTLTAGIAMGGPSQGNVVCKYDGSSWTTTTNYPDSKSRIGVAGTQTAAIGFGGQNSSGTTTNAFLFDGSTFTATGSLGVTNSSGSGHYGMGGSSPSTATVGTFQGDSSTEEFNQSASVITAAAWAAGGSLSTSRRSMHGGQCGLQDAGLAVGGFLGPPGRTGASEEYDGSSWTSGGTAPTKSSRGLAGIQTAAIEFGGLPSGPASTNTSSVYDGSSWTSAPTLNNSRGYTPTGGGTSTATIAMGGYAVPGDSFVTVTEYFNGSAWTAQAGANPNHYAGAGGGTQSAAWLVGGGTPPSPTNTEAYNWNGSSWTASGNFLMPNGDNYFGGGTQTAGWICGGNPTSPGYLSTTNHYDGTVFSTAPSMGTARQYGGSNGIQSGALIFGGYTGSNTAATEEFTGDTTSFPAKTLTTG